MKSKLLKGCGILVVLLLIVGVTGYALVRRWVFASAEPLDGRRLATADTRLVVLYEARADDAQARALVRAIVAEARRKGDLDAKGEQLILGWLGYDSLDAFADDLLPIRVGVLIEKDMSWVSYVSVSRFANLVERMWREQLERQGPPVDGEVYRKDGDFAAVAGNTMVWGSRAERVQAALAATGAEAPALPLLAQLQSGALQGAISPADGFIRSLWDHLKDAEGTTLTERMQRSFELSPESLGTVQGKGVLGADSLTGTVWLALGPEAPADKMVRRCQLLLEELVRSVVSESLRLEPATTLEGRVLKVELKLTGLRALWDK